MTARITTQIAVPNASLGRAQFVAAANDFGNALGPYASQANALADEVNANASTAAEAATHAETARDAAIAASQANADDWTAGAYAKNAMVWGDDGDLYRCIVAVNSSTPPSQDSTHWQRILTTAQRLTQMQADIDARLDVPVVAKSGALARADRGCNVQLTGTLTVPTFAASQMGPGTTLNLTNLGGVAQQVTPAAGVTLYNGADGATGAVTLSARSKATLTCEQPDVWMLCGSNVA